MRGTASESNENPHFNQTSLTVSQLLAFNTAILTQNQSLSLYHSRKREPPLPVYLAQMFHTKTRNLSTSRNVSKLGLCISKDRYSHVSVCIGNAVIEMNEQQGHVLSKKLQICLGPFFMPRNTFYLRHFEIYLPCFQYGGTIPNLLQPSNLFLMYWVQH